MSSNPIKNDDIISIHFTLKNAQGELIESTEKDKPLSIMVGHNNTIIGLEKALLDKKLGDQFHAVIKPEEAYGMIHEEAMQSIPFTAFEDVEDLEIGMRFHLQSDKGPTPVTITGIEDGMVSIDPHHPLAGKTLHFDIEVVEIRTATQTEINQGYPS